MEWLGGRGMKETKEWELGQWGELVIRRWLTQRGYWVVPASLIDNGGAPALETWLEEHISLPDLIAGRNGVSFWVEVKTKTKSVPHGHRQRDEHGVDERNWQDYLKAQEITGIRGLLAIVQLQPERLLVNGLDEVAVSAFLYDGPNVPAPRRFFDVRRFEWFEYGAGWLKQSKIGPTAPKITPSVEPRPWEDRYHEST